MKKCPAAIALVFVFACKASAPAMGPDKAKLESVTQKFNAVVQSMEEADCQPNSESSLGNLDIPSYMHRTEPSGTARALPHLPSLLGEDTLMQRLTECALPLFGQLGLSGPTKARVVYWVGRKGLVGKVLADSQTGSGDVDDCLASAYRSTQFPPADGCDARTDTIRLPNAALIALDKDPLSRQEIDEAIKPVYRDIQFCVASTGGTTKGFKIHLRISTAGVLSLASTQPSVPKEQGSCIADVLADVELRRHPDPKLMVTIPVIGPIHSLSGRQ